MSTAKKAMRDGQPSPSSVGVRLQSLDFTKQALILARLAANRSPSAQFSRKDVEQLFEESFLPKPTNLSDTLGKLRSKKLLTRGTADGTWVITPMGRQLSVESFSDIDLAALSAESAASNTIFGRVTHTIVPPTLAPPGLIPRLSKFLEEHPFERNVFGMTRFPESDEPAKDRDPVAPALEIAREACRMHGLELHLASDRAIDDDLWTNVAAHMWASHYGIAFFEDRRKRGLNYNLTIEVGSMLMTGRRCALLRDTSIQRMPTDLVGQIYKSVDFGKLETISEALHEWIHRDLNLGPCAACKSIK